MAELKGGKGFEEALSKIGAALGSGKKLRVGFLENASYPDGTKVALVAAIQNFGAPARNIPPRPFFSNMIRDKSKSWPDAIAKNLKANNFDVDKSLSQVGMGIKGQLQDSIRDFKGAPLAPETVRRKGFDKALIDTGQMLNSVDYDVK